jgi:superfamily II DNA helicase RecQ
MSRGDIGNGQARVPWNEIDLSELAAPEDITNKIYQRFGIAAKAWQACVTDNCCISGDDVVVIAGTGSGKSLVSQAILALSPKAIVLVVSPTLALIRDQVCHPRQFVFQC